MCSGDVIFCQIPSTTCFRIVTVKTSSFSAASVTRTIVWLSHILPYIHVWMLVIFAMDIIAVFFIATCIGPWNWQHVSRKVPAIWRGHEGGCFRSQCNWRCLGWPGTALCADNYLCDWLAWAMFDPCIYSLSPPVDIIWAMVILWRIRDKIVRTVLCCVVYDSCAQWYTHTHEQF